MKTFITFLGSVLLTIALFLISLILKSIYVLILIGLMLSAMPESWIGTLLSLPILERVDLFLMWLAGNSMPLAAAFCLIKIVGLIKDVEIMKDDQMKHSFVVGSVANYLEVTDYEWDKGMQEVDEKGFTFELWKKRFTQRIIGGFLGGEQLSREMQGADPFNTRFKRGGKRVTFKEDLEHALQKDS